MPRKATIKLDRDAIKADPVEFAHELLKGPVGDPLEVFQA
jgi:hypothetical protein